MSDEIVIRRVLALAPEKRTSTKYSANLHSWLQSLDRCYRKSSICWWTVVVKLGSASDYFDVEHQNDDFNQAPATYIGFDDGEGFFYGSRLSEITTQGGFATRWAYPFADQCVDITDKFWERYLRLGKCAIDPEHKLYNDRDRYSTSGLLRDCIWCGRKERGAVEIQKQERVIWRSANSRVSHHV